MSERAALELVECEECHRVCYVPKDEECDLFCGHCDHITEVPGPCQFKDPPSDETSE